MIFQEDTDEVEEVPIEKPSIFRKWSDETMRKAVDDVTNNKLTVMEASRVYDLPLKTLRRHIVWSSKGEPIVSRALRLGPESEQKVIAHVKRLKAIRYPLNNSRVKSIIYEFIEKLKLPHRFDRDKKQVGRDWFKGFMKRHPDVNTNKEDDLSLAKTLGINREEINNYFEALLKLLTDNDFLHKPDRIYNMIENSIPVKSKIGRSIPRAVKNKDSNVVECDHVSLIACCNAQGTFLPPVLIMKGKDPKPEIFEDLPPGSEVYINQKSSYINAELFYKWMKDHFIPRKPDGRVLLILDPYYSLSYSFEMLEIAEENDIIILCLPSHTTQTLNPLDKAFSKPFNGYFATEVTNWYINNEGSFLDPYHITKLIAKSWCKFALPLSSILGFNSTGVYPYDPNTVAELLKPPEQVPNQNIQTIQQNNSNIDVTCLECQGTQDITEIKNEWFRCAHCSNWLHKECTKNEDKCNKCCAKNKGIGKKSVGK